ncbi:MAG: hypothetical protein NT012_01090 [Candidatus Nealsonbacteria bacterium]|nr:hypothetical protein [Candidatus Nealsonbacteria bacterium]
MIKVNYIQICSKILKTLSPRQKEVILRRFALFTTAFPGKGGAKRETLESIGKDLGITRERVRQIEEDGFLRLKPEIKKYQKIFNYFKNCLKKTGDLRKEESLLLELAGRRLQSEEDKSSSTSPLLRESSMNEVYFLLTLGEDFERFGETKDFYCLWTIDQKSWNLAQKIINAAYEKFKKVGKPLKLEELVEEDYFFSTSRATAKGEEEDLSSLTPKILTSYLEISKKIQRNAENFWGLKDWPEINPKRIKDKAYLVFKKEQKPLHFTQVANLIGLALPQTVHNELIKDSKFVLVGRGIYALKEWGYEEGVVKDVILNILKTAGRPLKKEEILEKTLKQRLVKENTVLLNLSNKKYFLRNSEGLYTIREA